eukprot:comp23226_c2_seq2/m.37878 comp23226_c2_seq2/g.37878  ORF comp23226_c2_seq2/g.37878 comp23226_c2_seq2/m.37878 type:complete len:219 (-) comp23226_c2_seq2:1702-2358(-)
MGYSSRRRSRSRSRSRSPSRRGGGPARAGAPPPPPAPAKSVLQKQQNAVSSAKPAPATDTKKAPPRPPKTPQKQSDAGGGVGVGKKEGSERVLTDEQIERRVAVFVRTPNCTFWKPALVVPPGEIDETMPRKRNSTDILVRYLDDFTYVSVPERSVRLFTEDSGLYRLFVEVDYEAFSTHVGVKRALVYMATGQIIEDRTATTTSRETRQRVAQEETP